MKRFFHYDAERRKAHFSISRHPAYNEEERIANIVQEIGGYLQKKEYTYEIIVADDGSQDSIVELVSGISRNNGNIRVLRNYVNRGRG